MKPIRLPLPALGIDLLSAETAILDGAVRRAENVDIRRDGRFSRRPGHSVVVHGAGFQALYKTGRGLLAVRNGKVYAIDLNTYSPTLLCDLGSNEPADFTEHNGHLYFGNATSLWWVPADEAAPRRVGVSLPGPLPLVEAHPSGALAAGRYTIAISRVDDRGEESQTKVVGQVDLPSGGGIRLYGMVPDVGSSIRAYITPPDGDALYLSESFSAAFSEFVVSRPPDGATRSTQHLAPLPAGEFVRGHAGRLYVARDDTLFFSEPLRPHLHDPRHNFIKFVGPVRFLEAVVGGVFVGDDRGVWFLPGNEPEQIRRASSVLAIRRSSVLVPGMHFDKNLTQTDQDCAVWLSAEGYMLGRASGDAVSLHPERVRVAATLEGRSRFIVRDGLKQIITLTAATTAPGYGIAADTTPQ